MLSCRLFRTPTVPHRIVVRKLCGFSSNPGGKKAIQQYQVFLNKSVPRIQFRTSTSVISKKIIAGGKGLRSQTTPVKKESVITLARIAYAVKLVRLPFLLVAISTIGYQRGGKLISG